MQIGLRDENTGINAIVEMSTTSGNAPEDDEAVTPVLICELNFFLCCFTGRLFSVSSSGFHPQLIERIIPRTVGLTRVHINITPNKAEF